MTPRGSGSKRNACMGCVFVCASIAAPPVAAQTPLAALPVADVEEHQYVRHPMALSRTGRFVAFESYAPLVPDDTNGAVDIYLLDRQTSDIILVSRGHNGSAADGPSQHPTISDEGSRVVFESIASNLVEAAPEATWHVYAFTRDTRGLQLVTSDGAGRPIPGNHGGARLSGDGRVVVFHANGVPAPWNACGSSGYHVYRRTLESAEVEAISGGCPHTQSAGTFPVLSRDGSVVVYVRNQPGTTRPSELWMHDFDGQLHGPAVNAVHGRAPDAASYSPTLSADGRWLAFVSRATNLVTQRRRSVEAQVYLRRLPDGPLMLLSSTRNDEGGNGPSGMPSIDEDGQHVVFHSSATNLVCEQRPDRRCTDINMVTDIVLWSISTTSMTYVSDSADDPWLDASAAPVISGDSSVIAFISRHPVDANDDRHTSDLFLYDRRR